MRPNCVALMNAGIPFGNSFSTFVKLTLPEGWDEALGIDLMNRGLINEFKRDLELAQAGMFAGSADAERSIDTRREPLPF